MILKFSSLYKKLFVTIYRLLFVTIYRLLFVTIYRLLIVTIYRLLIIVYTKFHFLLYKYADKDHTTNILKCSLFSHYPCHEAKVEEYGNHMVCNVYQ